MEDEYSIQDEVLTLKPMEDRLDGVILERRAIVFQDTSLESSASKMNSIEVETFLDDNFGENDSISKQIIVERIDDFIGERQFEDLNVDHNTFQAQDFSSDNTITIVPDALNNSVGETQIIADHDADIEAVHTNYFHDGNSLGIHSEIPLETLSCNDKKIAALYIKEEPDEMENNFYEAAPSSSDRISRSRMSHVKEKRQIRIDKNDPRSRLHFVKYMKKDGKIIKLWECGICEKEFIHQYTLTRHLPTHTDERNYKCKLCGKAFRQMSTLAQHKATHSEFRPYVCDICQKTFSRVSTLISHKKIHMESKPHVCRTCGKGFHQKGNLKNHFFTHTNERPYKCDVCGRGFNQASNLQCHKLKTHLQKGNAPQLLNNKYKCSHCSESFSRRAQLRHHEEYIHEIKNVFSSKNSLRPNLIPSRNPLLKKKKMGSIRIIQMPPEGEDEDDKLIENDIESANPYGKMGILIDPIDTKAMHKTLANGNIPFALLKPAKSSPVVVKVQLCDGSKHMLVPASASELKSAGKFFISSEQDGNRTVQIKVPVVATIHQRVDESGEVHIDIEPPSDEEPDKQDENNIMEVNTISRVEKLPTENQPLTESNDNKNSTIVQVQHFIMNPTFTKPLKDNILSQDVTETESLEEIALGLPSSEGMEYILPTPGNSQLIEISPPQQTSVDLLASAVSLTNEPTIKDMEGNVQYLRPTENLGEYEVIGPDDGALFTESQSVIQQLKPLMEDNEPVTVDHSHLTALMNVLQTAGYEFQTDEDSQTHQIILNTVDDTIIVDNRHVQMVINDQQELNTVDVSSMTIEEVDSATLSFETENSQ